MKFLWVFVVFALCICLTFGSPTPSKEPVKEEEGEKKVPLEVNEETMLSNQSQLDQKESEILIGDSDAKEVHGKRSKRWIWYSWGYPIVHSYAYVFG